MHELGRQRWQVELSISQNPRQPIHREGDVKTREPVVLGLRAALHSVHKRLHTIETSDGVRQNRGRLSNLPHEEHDHIVEGGQDRRHCHGEFVLRKEVSPGVRSQGLRAKSTRQ
jgi:hypothetical protein